MALPVAADATSINHRRKRRPATMKILEWFLKFVVLAGFLALMYRGTIGFFPCLCYPTAYDKMAAFGTQVEAFADQHGHLPDLSNPLHLAELGLGDGYSASYQPETGRFWLSVVPGTDPDDQGDALMPFKPGLDGPWVVYDARHRTVLCGHR